MNSKKIVIVYSSNSGSTREVAEYIGKILSEKGYKAKVQSTEEAKSVQDFDAVIIGSSIFYGKWRKEATAFVEKNKSVLKLKKVFYFLTCMSIVNENEAKIAEVDDFLAKERRLVEPILEGRFAGEIDKEKLNLLHKMMIKMIKSPIGDFREWHKIEKWAKEVSEKI